MDISTFDELLRAARQQLGGPPWTLVFAAALSGWAGLPPPDSQVDAALQPMVQAVRGGDVERLIPFDRDGRAVRLG